MSNVDLGKLPRCVDCRHYESPDTAPQVCSAPPALKLAALVVGDVGPRGYQASIVRMVTELCGISGRWFERKE